MSWGRWSIGLGGFFLLVLVLLYAPILYVFGMAFVPPPTAAASGLTLRYFGELFADSSVTEALTNSAIAAVGSTMLSLIAATGYAMYLRNRPPALRRLVEALIYAPFFLPPIIVGLSLLLASMAADIDRGLTTIIIGHSLFTLAIVYRIVSLRLANLPVSHIEASADLGASRWQTMRFIILPHLKSAFIASGLLAVLLSFDETLITALIAGDTTTLPLRLWAMMRVGFGPIINALVVVVLGVCILLSAAILFVVSRNKDAMALE